MPHHMQSFVFCCYFRQEVDRKIDMTACFSFRGALASLPGNLIKFSVFFHFFTCENFTAHYFWETCHFCNFSTLCTPLAVRHLAPFVWQIPSVKREIFNLRFSWVAITWLLDLLGGTHTNAGLSNGNDRSRLDFFSSSNTKREPRWCNTDR